MHSRCTVSLNELTLVVQYMSEILTIKICGSRSFNVGLWIHFRCFDHHHNDYCIWEINFLIFLTFSRIFIHVLIGLALLWPINGCSPEASIAHEVQLINKQALLSLTSNLSSTSSTEHPHSNSSNL